MGFFDKLKFWKKEKKDMWKKEPQIEPSFEGGRLAGDRDEFGMKTPEEKPPLKDIYMPGREPFTKPPGEYPSRNRDEELILSKIETVRAILESMDHRLAVIEKRFGEEGRRY